MSLRTLETATHHIAEIPETGVSRRVTRTTLFSVLNLSILAIVAGSTADRFEIP